MITRRCFLFSAALPLVPALIPSVAQALTPGKEYAVIAPPIDTLDPKRVEILELFWYGCPHCFTLEPELTAWVKTLPKHAYFRRVPAVFSQTPHWVPLARAFYAAEILGLSEKLHYDFFNAIHLSGQNLNDREALLKLVQKQGVNRKQFEQALDSPEVNARLQQSQRFSAASGAKGVPALVVDGKYQTSLTQAGTPEQLFVTLNELISQALHSKKLR